MKLARYSLFVDAVCGDPGITRAVAGGEAGVAVYRHDFGRWYAPDGENVREGALEQRLPAALATGTGYEIFGTAAFFPVPALEAVIVTDFPDVPTRTELDTVTERIRINLDLSQDRFRATHHDLTGLINRVEFNRVLAQRLEALTAERKPGNHEPDAKDVVEVPEAVAIVAIDIDHFKQVNDTHGHLYGDIVLRALAYRLETMLRRRSASFGFEAIPAHPSGEEFLILLAGRFTKEQEREFAELVRTEVSMHRVPTDAEWTELTRGEPSDGIVLPDPAYRRLTISLGTCSVRGVVDRDAVRQLGFTLKSRADIALGKAKMAGRDRTVAFDDILRSLGRVLEHHEETDIVAIDLGRHVAVSAGQEFIVYHPTFVGNQPFLFDDGRTKRKLGEYPRVPSGRIEVFQVQADVSFCRVSDNRTRRTFVQGSLLEAVPLGSIAQLIPHEPNGRVAVLGQADLADRVQQITRGGSSPYAVVFSLLNADSLIESNGTAFVNRVLVALYGLIRKRLPRSPAVGQIMPTQLACVGFDDNDLEDSDVAALLQDVEGMCQGARLVAGVYTERDRRRFAAKQDLPEMRDRLLDEEGALEFARHASTAARHHNTPIVHFDHLTPDVVLSLSRYSLLIEQTEQDYLALERLGAVNSRARNQLGIAYLNQREYARADAIFASIVELDLAEPALQATYLNNSATNRWLLGDSVAAMNQFTRAMQLVGRSVPDGRYRGYYVLSLYGAYRSSQGDITAAEIEPVLRQALAGSSHSLPRWQQDRIEAALSELEAGQRSAVP